LTAGSIHDRFSRQSVMVNGEKTTVYRSSSQMAVENSVMAVFLDLKIEKHEPKIFSSLFHDKIDHDCILGSYLINWSVGGRFSRWSILTDQEKRPETDPSVKWRSKIRSWFISSINNRDTWRKYFLIIPDHLYEDDHGRMYP
jgi:hypothetical protein